MPDDQKLPDLSLFLASATHDMKNSVGLMSGTLEVLLADASVKMLPAYRQIAHMLYETRRLNNNLIQLLALYKEIGSASYPFDPQMQEIAQFVADIEAQNRVLLNANGIEFEAVFPADLLWIFDDDLLYGVINHALNNAVHYTKDKIRLIIEPAEGYLEMRVEDNGKGYPPAMLNIGAAIKPGVNFMTGSTGLGLYFSSEVARMHSHQGRSGSIRLENGGAWGGGCFVLRLP